MASYYAIQRSDSTLSHYGVKGMKWGIRKAVDKAYSGRTHSASFHRVKDKLQRLSEERMTNKIQKAQVYGRNRKVKRLYNKATEKLDELSKKADRNYQRGQHDQMKEDQSRMFWWSDSAGNLGSGPTKNTMVRVMNRIDGARSKRLTTDKGHAKAVKKRNDYAKQMARMFAGTNYAAQTKAVARKRMRVQK